MIRLIEIKLSCDSVLTIPEAYSAISALYPDLKEITIERHTADEDTVRVFDDSANESAIRIAVVDALNDAYCAKATKE